MERRRVLENLREACARVVDDSPALETCPKNGPVATTSHPRAQRVRKPAVMSVPVTPEVALGAYQSGRPGVIHFRDLATLVPWGFGKRVR